MFYAISNFDCLKNLYTLPFENKLQLLPFSTKTLQQPRYFCCIVSFSDNANVFLTVPLRPLATKLCKQMHFVCKRLDLLCPMFCLHKNIVRLLNGKKGEVKNPSKRTMHAL